MSITSRKNSLFKSSISIKSIGNTATSFLKSLTNQRIIAQEITEKTRETNKFKRTLISNDNKFFRKRQENIRRKDREDELEASQITGITKTQGAVLVKSTRGFLGRMLNFIGILLIGWAVNNLPGIIKGIQSLIKNIIRIGGVLGFFVNGVKDVLVGIGSLITNTISNITGFDFLGGKKEVEDGLEGAQANIMKSQRELVESANLFADEDAFGIPKPPGFEVVDKPTFGSESQEQTQTNQTTETDQTVSESDAAEIDGIVDEIDKKLEVDDDEIALEIEGVKTDTEGVTASDAPAGSSGKSSAGAVSAETVADPREELKKKQSESIKNNNKIKEKLNTKKQGSTFIETKDSIDNINKSVTPTENTTLAPVDTYDPDFEGGTGGKRKVNLSSLVTPTKKDVDVKSKKKKGPMVYVVTNQVNSGGGGGSAPMSGGGGTSLNIPEVNDEKMLMKMQSTSSLKYT
tara:strand:- start:2543 stop:3925 length:1383 start_codon:yes stop_codon:yes gene_type:complete